MSQTRAQHSAPCCLLGSQPFLSLQSSMEVTSCWTHCTHTDGKFYQRRESTRTHTHACARTHALTQSGKADSPGGSIVHAPVFTRRHKSCSAACESACASESAAALLSTDPDVCVFVCACESAVCCDSEVQSAAQLCYVLLPRSLSLPLHPPLPLPPHSLIICFPPCSLLAPLLLKMRFLDPTVEFDFQFSLPALV